jgi:iduronate 2-sulfatase
MNKFIVSLLCGLYFCGCSAPQLSKKTAKLTPTVTNVLFIAIDDLRPELGCYGGKQVKTPCLDKLASTGVRFDRAYCQIAVCGASRASLMTGVLPTQKRFTNYRSRADKDTPWAMTLPEVFKKAGYTTLSNGKIFHTPQDTEARSWSEPTWRPKKNPNRDAQKAETYEKLSAKNRGRIYESADVEDDAYADGKTALKTIADLREFKKSGKPFFLACGFVKPHMPFYAPKRYWDIYKREEIELAENRYRPKNAPKDLRGSSEFRSYHLGPFKPGTVEFDRMMRHAYLACTSYVDKLTGDVLDELERLGLKDNTIVVIWGDHGWHLGEHTFWGKHNTMHLSTRVPLIIRVPGKKTGVSQSLVETSDIFPTLCTLAGIDVPRTVQGKSFETVLDHPAQSFRKAVYNRFGSGDALITDRFSYTQFKSGKTMLYDLQEDPDENQNIVAEPRHKGLVVEMRTLLKERIKEAKDGEPK